MNQFWADLAPGECVKISRNAERFWVEVTEIKDGRVFGKVDNDLIMNNLAYGDAINFPLADIIEVSRPPVEE